MSEAMGRSCDGCGQPVPDADFSCPGCGKFYAGSFSRSPAGAGSPSAPPTTPLPPPPLAPPPPSLAPPPTGWEPQPGTGQPQAWVPAPGPSGGSNRALVIVLAVVAGVVGLGVASAVALAVIGTEPEPQFRQIPMGPIGGGDEAFGPITTRPNPDGAALDDPVRVIVNACRDADAGLGSLEEWTAFNGLQPGGVGQFAHVVRMEEHGPVWAAAIDLATGAVEDGTDPDRLLEVGRHASVVACVMPNTGVPGIAGMPCSHFGPDDEGVVRETRWYMFASRRPISVYELATGLRLGTAEVDSTVTGCPLDPQTPNARVFVDLTDVELAAWASEHLQGGTFR